MTSPGRRRGGGGASRPEQRLTFRDRLHLYRPDLAQLLEERGDPAYRYGQLYDHLMRHPGVPWERSTALPSELRARLAEIHTSSLALAKRIDDEEGTSKLVFRAMDGRVLESVVMRYRKDVTVCVSSQIGCSLGCTFCATGAMGFRRDLSVAEIVDQVRGAAALLAGEERRLTNVVFMGMGEPLLNLDAVLGALTLLHDPDGGGLARRALSVSTIGIPGGIKRLAREEPQVHLALSLHAPNDELRRRLMPAARRYPLEQVLQACEEHFRLTRRKLFVEYLLLGGVNDAPRHAHALADLLRSRVVTVNLIPWNPTCEGYEPASRESTAAFREILEERGLEATIRSSRGWSIAAACGQLTEEGSGKGQKRAAKAPPAATSKRDRGSTVDRRTKPAGRSGPKPPGRRTARRRPGPKREGST